MRFILVEILKNQMTWIVISVYMFLVGIGIGAAINEIIRKAESEVLKNETAKKHK